ncbi:hypothetical protein WB66_11035 [bacteria symbiont BFo1 of Frankliniella occidentalis]|nr:hypothetical protein AI28_08090 [bacteria symbiont BFo1 of Frankliniella occidentalis]KYP84743.1 hypothetical protein WB66_11035 [bacteria symbiont BFo1 of Frankliniella occidentalis]
MKIKLLAVMTILVLVGCDRWPEPAKSEMGLASQLSADADRITVTKLSEFKDDLAYNDWRGVYLVKDKQTGKEWVGISGIGISEVGSHSQMVGKVMTQKADER